MELRSLLLSQDQSMIDVLQRALLDLGIGVEVYSTAEWAREDLSDSHFDAVIVDCDVSGAASILEMLHSSANNSRALTFAITNADSGLHNAFGLGANLALQKPITVERARSSLRAAYGLIMQERRKYFRLALDIPVRVVIGERSGTVANSMNISEGGMAIRSEDDLPLNGVVKLAFLLPGQKSELEARAVVVWKDPRGHLGLRFEPMSAESRQKLNNWLSEQTTFL